MTPISIQVCLDPRASHWQLGPLPPSSGHVTLVGWTASADRQDGGVPSEVAGVLARALTLVARVTFPSTRARAATEAWSSFDGGLIRYLSGRGVVERLMAGVRTTPSGAVLISTRQQEVAMQAFDDGGFPWWLQGQALLLSAPGATPPDIDEPMLVALFEDDWAERAASLTSVGVQGVARPGVDGDVAGLLSFSDTFHRAILGALERETRSAGLSWSIVPEAALSIAPPNPHSL